jgi:hypothetical protein
VLNVAEGVKNINPKHKEYVIYGEPQLCRVQKTAGACGPRCSQGHRLMCRHLVVLGARVPLSSLITGVLWYLWAGQREMCDENSVYVACVLMWHIKWWCLPVVGCCLFVGHGCVSECDLGEMHLH